jgi:hypothetical protein
VAELAKNDALEWHMRTLLLVVSVSVALACACGTNTENPFAAKCKEACQLETTHVCAGQVGKCSADCQALATKAQQDASKGMGQACGECVAGGMTYSVNPSCTANNESCCWGVLAPKSPGDPQCAPVCFEADGGVGY